MLKLAVLCSKMKAQKRNILMFVDNCGAHPDVKLSNIKLVFLPPNTTSRLQPCDAMLKAHYRKRLVCHVLVEMDSATTATELSKRVDVMDAISWLWLAWCSVTASTNSKCFVQCGFVEEVVGGQVDAEADPLEYPGEEYEELLGDVSWETYIAMDDATVTTDTAVMTGKLSSWQRQKGRRRRRMMTVVMRSQKHGHSSHPKMRCSISKTL